MVIRHRNRQPSGEPDGESSLLLLKVTSWRQCYVLTSPVTAEMLNIVHQSLRKKVASLDDDNWMFEPERDVRF